MSNEAAIATTEAAPAPELPGHGLGASLPAADARAKTEGTFPYAADLWAEGLLWAAVLRSPHPHARIVSVDTSHARDMPGVRAVITHEDVPGRRATAGAPPTARCSPPTSCATTGSPSPRSPPTTPTPLAWPPRPSWSSTRYSTR